MKESFLDIHLKGCRVKSNLFRMLTLLLLIFCTTNVFAQQKNVRGTVVDASGDPLIGVNVSVKGMTIGIITDMEGRYQLEVPANATLLFSYIGYRSQEIAVGNQLSINITMQEDTQNIDEVVVGDVVLLESGDKIPADGVLVNGEITVDESSLNGEAKEQYKYPLNGIVKDENNLYRGTVVYSKRGIMIVTSIGDQTIYGKPYH